MIDKLNQYEEEAIEEVKKQIDNFDDFRQVEAIYDYCFEVLNNNDYFELTNN